MVGDDKIPYEKDAIDWLPDDRMTGTESYPLHGNMMTKEAAEQIIRTFRGLKLYTDTLNKTLRLHRKFTFTQITIGSITVWSPDYESGYKIDFDPPHQYHAWCEYPEGVIDFALPEVIFRGLHAFDDNGPLLTLRDPIILAGKPPPWVKYKTMAYIPVGMVPMMTGEFKL